MSKPLPARAARSLAMILCATALVACGGGDDPPAAQNPNPNPQPGADFAFATPSSTTDTLERAAGIEPFTFAASPAQTAGTVQFESGVVSYSASLASNVAWAGVGLRFVAPGGTAVNASSYTKLKVQLASTAASTVTIKLQTTEARTDGCLPTTRDVMVTDALGEVEIDLNEATFAPACADTGTSFASAKQALASIEISNDSNTQGDHDVKVGTIKLVP